MTEVIQLISVIFCFFRHNLRTTVDFYAFVMLKYKKYAVFRLIQKKIIQFRKG